VTYTDDEDLVQVRRSYKFRAYPTCPQEGRAVRLLRDHCDLYNAALEERRGAWRMRKASVCYGVQSAQLKEIRRADPDGQGRHSFTAQQQTLRRLNDVFAAFCARCRAGDKKPGYPRFKPYSRFDQVRFVAASAEVIADLGRRKARAKPGSGNRNRIRGALAREWRKVRNRRHDFHHKTARALVDSCDVIALEDLNTAGMTKRPAPRPDPERERAFLPNNALAKAGLNKSILDAGWAQFAGILAAKAEEAGRRVILVNPAFTSIACHACGQRCTRPRRHTVVCLRCGPHDADVNGARNVFARAGLGSGQAAGAA
jgi:transposase